jgi:outer membrane protein
MLMRSFLLGLLMMLSFGLAAEGLKIGYVDATRVFEKSPQYLKARDRLQAEFKEREASMLNKQKVLKELEQTLKDNKESLSRDERQRLERDILTHRRKLKNERDAFREDFNLRRNDEFNQLRKKIGETVREYAKQHQYDLVVTDIVYASDRVDITDKVLQALSD